MGSQFENNFATVYSKIEQLETRHENLNGSGKRVQFAQEEGNDDEVESPPLSPMKLSERSKEKALLKKSKEPHGVDQEVGNKNECHEDQPKKVQKKSKKSCCKERALMHDGKEVNSKELPFPNSYLMSKSVAASKTLKEVVDFFSKLDVNLPFIDLIKNSPPFAKYLKELCTNKRRFKPNELVQVSPNVSSLFKPQIPIKCQDPSAFTIPCTIGKVAIARALLDLEAAINVIPLSMYQALGVGILQTTIVTLQLADRTTRKPEGILEDILVQVKGLLFPADFYILDMANVGEQVVSFNMYEAMRHPYEDYSLLGLNVIDVAIDNVVSDFELNMVSKAVANNDQQLVDSALREMEGLVADLINLGVHPTARKG
ncbi:uncharacterized protein LOC114721276 [Neltuma alba]|uniref:uncharacterized protein LOC114721276 n=1 Tax=Neltuma alba TaxID=207710 RepID=UPI0010A47C39|nr:uncharacterized protein LOC114721276 [Prosopis alba]